MQVVIAAIPDVLVIEPRLFEDERGYFFESYNQRLFCERTGLQTDFVQDNHSCSRKNVLRGLHYQIQRPQGRLVRVVSGEVFDVAVDLRRSSPTFGRWVKEILSAENKRMFWIPPGFAHGFLVLSDSVEYLYKTTEYRFAEHERSILWSDPDLAIPWPITAEPLLSAKDRAGALFRDAETYP